MGANNIKMMSPTLQIALLASIVMLAPVAVSAKGTCENWEFEGSHGRWSPACVAQWLEAVKIPSHVADHWEAQGITGSQLKDFNETTLALPAADGGLNVTEDADVKKIIEGVKQLERSDPSDSSESGLYLPIMLAGCTFFIYVMFIKDTLLERKTKNWWSKMKNQEKNTGLEETLGVPT